MGSIIKAEDLPEKDKVYLKRDIIGWRVVEPWKDPDTNKINWFNLLTGGKRNLAFLFILLIMGSILYLGTTELRNNYRTVLKNPCGYCQDCRLHNLTTIRNVGFNPDLYKFNFSINES